MQDGCARIRACMSMTTACILTPCERDTSFGTVRNPSLMIAQPASSNAMCFTDAVSHHTTDRGMARLRTHHGAAMKKNYEELRFSAVCAFSEYWTKVTRTAELFRVGHVRMILP